jgi:glycosyltransferase involved in cell wall biosynthesis
MAGATFSAGEHPTVTVVVPAFNEEGTIDELLRRLIEVADGGWQIIVVNDGSSDATANLLQEWTRAANVQVLHYAENRGKGAAVRTGLEHATGDVVVIQDADLEYDPTELPELVAAFRDERVQAVFGIRYGPHSRLPWTRFRLAVVLLNAVVWLLYGRRIHDEATCYKLVRRALLEQLRLRSERFELCAEITAKLCRLGVTIHERPISYHPRRYADGKKIGVSAFFRCVRELVRWRFAALPVAERSGVSLGTR